jgi:hypothetical protein
VGEKIGVSVIERQGDRPVFLHGQPSLRKGNGLVNAKHLKIGTDQVMKLRFKCMKRQPQPGQSMLFSDVVELQDRKVSVANHYRLRDFFGLVFTVACVAFNGIAFRLAHAVLFHHEEKKKHQTQNPGHPTADNADAKREQAF